MALRLGRDLVPDDQQTALQRWAQSVNAPEWLNRTRFRVNGKGRLDGRARNCYPAPPVQMLMPAPRRTEVA